MRRAVPVKHRVSARFLRFWYDIAPNWPVERPLPPPSTGRGRLAIRATTASLFFWWIFPEIFGPLFIVLQGGVKVFLVLRPGPTQHSGQRTTADLLT
jgi:hypothetical protein